MAKITPEIKICPEEPKDVCNMSVKAQLVSAAEAYFLRFVIPGKARNLPES